MNRLLRFAGALRRPLATIAVALLTLTHGPVGCGSHTSVHYARGSHHGHSGDRPADATLRGPFDEIWVIARDARLASSEKDPNAPRSGTLAVADPDVRAGVRVFPLERTDIQASIDGPIASVRVAQRFANPFAETIEAVYAFPLPHDAAIGDFTLSIGDRAIRGIVRPREEAEAIYRDARSQGLLASLLTEERPNIFTERVANIEPGRSVEVELTYLAMVPYREGWHEWRFPLVIGPRFHPEGAGKHADRSDRSDRTISAAPIGANASGQARSDTTVEYLAPGERTQRAVSISVALAAGAEVRDLVCRSHASARIARAGSIATVALEGGDEIADRDFVLAWSVAGATPASSMVVGPASSAPTGTSDGGGTFAFTLYPPAEQARTPRAPLELIFLIDRSGSMSGRPIEQVKEAILAALDDLEPDDAFQIVDFSDTATALGGKMLPANDSAKSIARSYVGTLSTGGGTRVLEGLRTALALPHVEYRARHLVLLTDAFVGNETEILELLRRDLGAARVFALGVGSSPNWFLLETMARTGHGAVAALPLDAEASETMRAFMERVRSPILHGITIDWIGGTVTDFWPQRIPDLVADRPITVMGRYRGAPPTAAILRGRVGGQAIESSIAIAPTTASGATLEKLWARAMIAQLSLESAWSPRKRPAIADSIRRTALAHGLMSPYTAFIAVDASRLTEGSVRRTIVQPSPMPAGVRYDTTVSGSDGG